MHPLDTNDRRELAQGAAGIGMCNITKCCTEVCPEGIKITDNAIIPMKERVVDRKYDPLVWLGETIGLRNKDNDGRRRSRPGHRAATTVLRPSRTDGPGGRAPPRRLAPTRAWSTASLVLGILSILTLNLLFGAIAIGSAATPSAAARRRRRHPRRATEACSLAASARC